MVHGLVVAHDSDTLMTYIVPILSVFESILRHFELPFSSMSSLFSIISSNTEQSSKAVGKEQDMKDGVDSGAISHKEQSVYELFSSKLESFTACNFSGQRYIHRSLLIDWLLSKHTSQATYLDLLLDFAYSNCIVVPVEARQLSISGKSSLLVFSLLLELGRGDLVHYFLRSGLTDSKLPFSMTILKQAKTSGDRSKTFDLTRQIFERQWAYCPLTFDLGMGIDLPSSTVIPIQQRQQINSKGGTATIWQIVVHEEFVGNSLRQETAAAKFKSVSNVAGSVCHFLYIPLLCLIYLALDMVLTNPSVISLRSKLSSQAVSHSLTMSWMRSEHCEKTRIRFAVWAITPTAKKTRKHTTFC